MLGIEMDLVGKALYGQGYEQSRTPRKCPRKPIMNRNG
jgi:hypothetical protein